MSQSRIGSFVESVVNVAIGFGVSMAANLIVLPAYGYEVTTTDAFNIGLVFTAISVVRSYFVRRVFNFLLTRHLAIAKTNVLIDKQQEEESELAWT